MKNQNQVRSSSSSGSARWPSVDLPLRAENQWLRLDKVMQLLRQQLPAQSRCAQVRGQWVWVTFSEVPAESVRQRLSQLGFSWSRTRQCWQHPCGQLPQWFPSAHQRQQSRSSASAAR